MKFNDIHIRDPFILPEDGKYYLYGSRGPEAWDKCTGLDVYVSDDLENWSEPTEVFTPPAGFWADMNFWAPEVHKYNGKYYMLVSFKSEAENRGTQILISESPLGPFVLHSDGPVTPREWECLDGTLYIENGKPYMIFCHEWVQMADGNGEMCVIELSDDLKCAVSEPVLLFKGADPYWVRKDAPEYVTDGPFMYRTAEGKLLMIWSSFNENGYVEAIADSDNGSVFGKWNHDNELLFSSDGGHGMIFKSFDGELYFICHSPNDNPAERPVIKRIKEENGTLITV